MRILETGRSVRFQLQANVCTHVRTTFLNSLYKPLSSVNSQLNNHYHAKNLTTRRLGACGFADVDNLVETSGA